MVFFFDFLFIRCLGLDLEGIFFLLEGEERGDIERYFYLFLVVFLGGGETVLYIL